MEYLLLFIEFHIIKGKSILRTLFFCLGLGVFVYLFVDNELYVNNVSFFNTTIIDILGILIGFTISAVAIFLSIDNSNINEAKNKKLNVKLYSKNISLYDSIFVGFFYIIIIQGFLLIANFICPLFVKETTVSGKILFSINISSLSYIILFMLKNVLEFYFILTKKNIV